MLYSRQIQEVGVKSRCNYIELVIVVRDHTGIIVKIDITELPNEIFSILYYLLANINNHDDILHIQLQVSHSYFILWEMFINFSELKQWPTVATSSDHNVQVHLGAGWIVQRVYEITYSIANYKLLSISLHVIKLIPTKYLSVEILTHFEYMCGWKESNYHNT